MVDVQVGEQNRVELRRIHTDPTEPFEHPATGVDQQPRPAVDRDEIARRDAGLVDERAPAAEHGQRQAGCGR